MSSISQLAEWFGMNPWLSLLSFILAVLGVALAIIFYFKGRKVKLPCYAVRSTNIVRNLVSKIESLEMLYSGKPIENLTVTKFTFWNAGRDTIDRRDIASADPLTFNIKRGYKILDAKILFEKKEANKFSITTSPEQTNSTLNFDYVDKDEGVIIQLIHTGKSREDIELQGTIKGASKLLQKRAPLPPEKRNMNKKLRYIFAGMFFGVPALVALDLIFR